MKLKRFDGKPTHGTPDPQMLGYRTLQEGRARAVKFTSSGHSQWWERAREALESQ